MKKQLSIIYIIIAGLCWGIIGLFSKKLATLGLNAIQITEMRCIITAVSLLSFTIIFDRNKLKISIKDIWIFLGTGILSIAFFNICYFNAIEYSNLSSAAILLYTAPFFVSIISSFIFKEKLTIRKIIALIISFIGCILAVGMADAAESITTKGLIFGLLSGFGYGLYSIFGRIALKKYHTLTVTTYTFITASIFLLPFCEINDLTQNICAEKEIIIFSLLLGIISTLVPFILYTKGLSLMDTGTASIIAYFEPLVATMCGLIVFKEKTTFLKVTGIILIFISIIILNYKKKVKEKIYK